MNKKNQNKYRIATTRHPGWDYSWNAEYFITICTAGHKNYFGKIKDKIMELSKIGIIAEKYWLEIPRHFPFVELNDFVIMPNHVHGILIINKNKHNVETQNLASKNMSTENTAQKETQNLASLQNTNPSHHFTYLPNNKTQNKFGSQSRNLSSIIRGFKIGITKYAKVNGLDFAWQPRYYDRIIRDEKELIKIRNYIVSNPENWHKDKLFN